MDGTYIEIQGTHSTIFYMSQVQDGKIYDNINTGSNEDKPVTQSHLLPHSVYTASCSSAAKL